MYNQQTEKFIFKKQKALEVIIYIANHVSDLYHVLKIIYFADKEHLSRYGRFINGDSYVAMKDGPVPSQSYDIIKALRGDGLYGLNKEDLNSVTIVENEVKPNRKANLDFLSETDIECLDESIKKYKDYTFNDLHKESSDAAYDAADRNNFMSIIDIAKTLKNSDEVVLYLSTIY
ncbi:MAG: hypothetical protein C0412_08810 [Flavobacterium sp.]|nr:hypothetical protein [Flavobacterium sp.]